MNAQFWWYVARSGGVVAWGLATLSVLWGLLLSSRVVGPRVDGRKLLDLHRFLGGLTVVFALIHGLGLLLDDELSLGVVELLVPLASDWEPGALAAGIVAFYLLVAVEVTSLLRHRVGDRAWQYVHYAGFGVFLFGTIHGLRVGTDVENPLIWWPAAIASAGVVALCAYRIFSGDPVPVVSGQERVPASVLERTLSQLEQLDTSSYPAAVPPALGPRPQFPPLSQAEIRASAATVSRPPVESGLPIFPGRTGRDVAPSDQPRQPPMPSRAPFDAPRRERTLPTRVPQRLTATTAPAAGLGSWAPASRAESGQMTGAPPPPPDAAVDPATGEPDPQAYRKWLRDWLQYVESQP